MGNGPPRGQRACSGRRWSDAGLDAWRLSIAQPGGGGGTRSGGGDARAGHGSGGPPAFRRALRAVVGAWPRFSAASGSSRTILASSTMPRSRSARPTRCGRRPPATAPPWSAYRTTIWTAGAVYPPDVFAAQLDRVADGFAEGHVQLTEACHRRRWYPRRREHREFIAEQGVAEAASIHFRSAANQARFVQTRSSLDGAHSTVEAAAAGKILGRSSGTKSRSPARSTSSSPGIPDRLRGLQPLLLRATGSGREGPELPGSPRPLAARAAAEVGDLTAGLNGRPVGGYRAGDGGGRARNIPPGVGSYWGIT